jgi:PKD repeat protein
MPRTLFAFATVLALFAIALPSTAAAAPSNDVFGSATVIDPATLPFSDAVDITGATTDPGEPQACSFMSQTVWYSITPSADAILGIDASGSSFFDTDLNVYRQDGSGLSGLSFLGCANFGNQTTISVQAGQTYYIQGGKVFGGSGTLQVNVHVVPPPPNDNFADAKVVGGLPFNDVGVDMTAATVEPGEPLFPNGAFTSIAGSVWYRFTPTESGSITATPNASTTTPIVAVYTGDSLANLSQVAGKSGFSPLTFQVDAGTTYDIQLGRPFNFGQSSSMSLRLEVAPNPVASLAFFPTDPSTFDTVQFQNFSFDPGGMNLTAASWDFGDGSSSTDFSPTHRYSVDGDYILRLTVTTSDGRTGSTTATVHVRTHDVAITKLTVPQSASAGQTRQIVVGISNVRYGETVQVQLFRNSDFSPIGTLTQLVPVRTGGRTTSFSFNYTFTGDDAALGKVTFRAVATIIGARDAAPADNSATALPTKVTH